MRSQAVAIAGYLAATAVIQLIAGPMADRFGRRPVLLVALTVFTLASVVCSLAENIWVFLAFRMLQGGVSAGYTLSLAIVRDTNPPQKAAGLLGYISMCMAIAPMLGPVLGGILDTAFGWRSNFYAYSFCGAALLILCWLDLGETRPGYDTDHPARSGPAKHGTPLTLIKDPRFCAYVLCTAFSVGAFYIFLAGAPLVATTDFGISTAELGFFIGSITLGFSAGGFLSGRFASKVSLTAMMLTGRIIACAGMTMGLAIISLGWVSPAHILCQHDIRRLRKRHHHTGQQFRRDVGQPGACRKCRRADRGPDARRRRRPDQPDRPCD